MYDNEEEKMKLIGYEREEKYERIGDLNLGICKVDSMNIPENLGIKGLSIGAGSVLTEERLQVLQGANKAINELAKNISMNMPKINIAKIPGIESLSVGAGSVLTEERLQVLQGANKAINELAKNISMNMPKINIAEIPGIESLSVGTASILAEVMLQSVSKNTSEFIGSISNIHNLSDADVQEAEEVINNISESISNNEDGLSLEQRVYLKINEVKKKNPIICLIVFFVISNIFQVLIQNQINLGGKVIKEALHKFSSIEYNMSDVKKEIYKRLNNELFCYLRVPEGLHATL